MLRRDPELKSKWGTICPPVEMLAPDGKRRKTQAADPEVTRDWFLSYLEWPDLDVDLEIESLQHPERYPLVMKRNPLDYVNA